MNAPNALNPADLAARVVAWHNRQPLARRITPAQVVAMGIVALPFKQQVQAGKTSKLGRYVRAFSDSFIRGLPPWWVAPWAVRHGSLGRPGPPDWPLREIDSPLPPTERISIHVFSAAIEAGDARRRVLISTTNKGSVLGWRVPALPRAGLLALGIAAGVAMGVSFVELLRQRVEHPPALAMAPVAASAAPATASATARAASAPLMAAPASASVPAPAPAAVAHAASAAPARPVAPVHTAVAQAAAPVPEPEAASAPRPRIRPSLSPEERSLARREGDAARRSAASARAAAAQKVAKTQAAMPVYVLVGGALPEREKAQAQVMAMRVAARRSHLAHMPRTEVLQVADQWRAIWWFSGPRADADRLRAVLAAQGLRVEVVEM